MVNPLQEKPKRMKQRCVLSIYHVISLWRLLKRFYVSHLQSNLNGVFHRLGLGLASGLYFMVAFKFLYNVLSICDESE